MPCVPYVPAWSACSCAHVPKACQLLIFTCQRANKCANMQTCQFFNLACQRVPRRAKILTWLANVPKGVPFFQIVFKRIMFFHIPNKFLPNTFYIFYILNIYLIYIFYMNIFFYLTLYIVCKKSI